MLIKRIWIDTTEGDSPDAETGDADVMVEMETAEVWTAHFVTVPYLQQQLELSMAMTPHKIGFMALDTPHVIIQRLERDVIEDVVYELMGSGTFESVFDLVIDIPQQQEEED